MTSGEQTFIAALAPTPPDVPALGSGWIAYASWSNDSGTPVSSFSTTWIVPPQPKTQSGQTVFLFNGIEDRSQQNILQPVLQWGTSAAGGGSYWSIGNWYVASNGHAFYSKLVQVQAGETLTGIMEVSAQAGAAFNYTSRFLNYAEADLSVQSIAELTWCNETLEAYGIQECSDYPATSTTTFTTINISTGASIPAVVWAPTTVVSDCGQQVNVLVDGGSGGSIEIAYGTGTSVPATSQQNAQ